MANRIYVNKEHQQYEEKLRDARGNKDIDALYNIARELLQLYIIMHKSEHVIWDDTMRKTGTADA